MSDPSEPIPSATTYRPPTGKLHRLLHSELSMVLATDKAYGFLPAGDWMAGGCALLAQALLPLLGDGHQLKMLGRMTPLGVMDHMVIETPQGLFVDHNGVQTRAQLEESFKEDALINDELFITKPDWPALVRQGVVDPQWDIDGLSHLLREWVNG